MVQEFTPKLTKTGTENLPKGSSPVDLHGDQRVRADLANRRYEEALMIAEDIDNKNETVIPWNQFAVRAAQLTAFAAIRGAEVA